MKSSCANGIGAFRTLLAVMFFATLLFCVVGAPAAAQDEGPLDALQSLIQSDRDAAMVRLNERLVEPADASATERTERAQMLFMRATLLRDRRDYDSARADAEAMRALAESLQNASLSSRALYLLGTIEAEAGDFAGALRLFQQADQVLEGTDAWGERSRAQSAIGTVHHFSGNPERAIDYFDIAHNYAELAGDVPLQISALSNKAVALADTRGAEESLAAHRAALALAESIGDTAGQGLDRANICARLVALERLEEAEPNCRQALETLESNGADRHLAGARMTMGNLMLERGDPEQALTFYRSALELARDEVPSVERELLQQMANATRMLGRHEAAADHLEALLALRDRIERQDRREVFQELEARYRVKQAEQEVAMLELETELNRVQLRRRNLMLIGTTLLLLLVSGLGLLAWRSYRMEKKLMRELAERNKELQSAVRTIGRLARIDSLTGLLTRPVFLAAAEQEIARKARSGDSTCMVMADVDNFKPVNDLHGHAAGDEVLVQTAKRLRDGLRKMDFLCRWGGEEFIGLLPGASREEAEHIIERVRRFFSEHPIETEAGRFPVTLTFGIALLEDDVDACIKAADAAMYTGKRAGRNRVVVHQDAKAGS